MKKILLSLIALAIVTIIQAQLTVTPNGGNKKAMVGERIGITDVSIHYDRPGVKGREGKIFGGVVNYGYNDLGFGNTKQAPWRGGANENTTIEFSTDVKIEGQNLPAGKYGFFIAADPSECTLIFSKNYTSWGSFFYDPKEDALRVKVKPVMQDNSTEWLKYEFEDEQPNSAVVALIWEKWKIPFKVEVDYVNTQLESFRKELRSDKGFFWESWNQAAQWCLQNNVNLDQALAWTDTATSVNFGGDKNFTAWSTKAQILNKLNRNADADVIMQKALPFANTFELHQYARELLTLKKNKEAYDVFKMNYDKNPNTFTTNMGMARGLSAMGKYNEALKYVQAAQPQAPDAANKANVENFITSLKAGKDINQ